MAFVLLLGLVTRQAASLDNNLQVVDLTDLAGDLPLNASSIVQILWRTQDWEHGSFNNPSWPSGGEGTFGYPTVVKNTHGLNPDGKYYLYYAHHDPMSGIGCAVANSATGTYTKISPTDSKVLTVPNYNPAGPDTSDPSHYSSPSVVWNDDDGLWFMYFHYFNHLHSAWDSDPTRPGQGWQMMALATCPDLSSHNWTIYTNTSFGSVSTWDIIPVLHTTDEDWANESTSYDYICRLVDGTWLAFMRGTTADDSDGTVTELGFASSSDGSNWNYFAENPVIETSKPWTTSASEYRPKFIGYLGSNGSGDGEYLVAWAEHGNPQIVYSKTTDFKTFTRDLRGYATWGVGDDGIVSAWREGNNLYLFSGVNLNTIDLSAVVGTTTSTSTIGPSTTTTSSTTTDSTTTGPIDDACIFYPVDSYGGTLTDTVPDVSGNGQHGVADGIVFPQGVTAGINGNAAIFPGGADIYVAGEVPPSGTRFENQSLSLGTSDFTISMWVRAIGPYSAGGGSDGLVFNPPTLQLYLSKNGSIQFEVPGDSATMASTVGTAIPVNSQWYHVAVTVNRDNAGGNPSAIYLNGSNITGTDTLENTPTTLAPGAGEFWTWGRTLTGHGDDFAIIKEALSEADVASIGGFTTTTSTTSSTSTAGTSTTSTSSTSTTSPLNAAAVHYTLEAYGGAQTDTVTDVSGNGQHGIADGGVFSAGIITGRNGNAARFPGGADIYMAGEVPPSGVRFQNDSLSLGAGDFTITSWVRATGAYDGNGGPNGTFLEPNPGVLNLRLSKATTISFGIPGNSATMTSSNGTAIPVNSEWYHVAVVVNRDNDGGSPPSAIYVNAKNVTDSGDPMEDTPASIGTGQFFTWGRALTGEADDLAIIQQALSQAQVASLSGVTTSSTTTLTSTTIGITTSSTTTTSINTINVIQDFEDWPTTADWGTSSHEGWTLSDGQVKQSRGGFGAPIDTRCGWLYDFDLSTNSWIQSPLFTGGVISVSFWTRQDAFSGGSSFAVLQTSSNESEWTDIDAFTVSTASWTQRMYAVNMLIPTYLRIRKTGDTASDAYAGIDDIDVVANVIVFTTTTSSSTSTSTTTITSTTTTSTTSTTVVPPVIVNMNRDVTLWAVYTPTGSVVPIYSTNLGTVPIEWLQIPVFSNSPESGTNVISFDPPDTNASVIIYRLQQNL